MDTASKYKIPADYYILLCICTFMAIWAFFLDSPSQILNGIIKINTSRSVLVSDYVALGGIGAALLNAAMGGLFYLTLLIIYKIKPTGKIILALFLTIGFSLFGKNLFNMLPIFFGVWLYAIFNKEKISRHLAHAMVSGTVGPIVSEIAFLHDDTSFLRIIAACAAGLFIGFIFPIIMEAAKRMHRGFCLYNGGIAGGFIATFFVGILASLGIEIVPEEFWDTDHTVILARFAFALGAALVIWGFVKDHPLTAIKKYWLLQKESDETDNDYLVKYGNSTYINIGVLCIITTSLMMFLNIPINGPVLGGILTVTGFGAAGKHLRSTLPVLIGSMAAAHLNFFDVGYSNNSLAILFSTGLAPIAGKFGFIPGIVVGFVHVSIAIIVGNLNGGMNLYNNGFAGGFVAITTVPIIIFLKDFRQNRKLEK